MTWLYHSVHWLPRILRCSCSCLFLDVCCEKKKTIFLKSEKWPARLSGNVTPLILCCQPSFNWDWTFFYIAIPIGSMYAIYGNMDPINIPPMLAYIPAPWILWQSSPSFPIISLACDCHPLPPPIQEADVAGQVFCWRIATWKCHVTRGLHMTTLPIHSNNI